MTAGEACAAHVTAARSLEKQALRLPSSARRTRLLQEAAQEWVEAASLAKWTGGNWVSNTRDYGMEALRVLNKLIGEQDKALKEHGTREDAILKILDKGRPEGKKRKRRTE